MSPFTINLATVIDKWINTAGAIAPDEAARALGKSYGTVHRWTTGESQPDAETLNLIVIKFGRKYPGFICELFAAIFGLTGFKAIRDESFDASELDYDSDGDVDLADCIGWQGEATQASVTKSTTIACRKGLEAIRQIEPAIVLASAKASAAAVIARC